LIFIEATIENEFFGVVQKKNVSFCFL